MCEIKYYIKYFSLVSHVPFQQVLDNLHTKTQKSEIQK